MSTPRSIQIALATVILALLAGSADGQGRRSYLPPLTPAEAEAALRYEIQRQLQRRVSVPDSASMQRLISVSLRYRDSTRMIGERERIIRSELNREGFPAPPRVINEARISCLLGQLSAVERRRFEIGVAERAEVATFLAPLSRFQYLGTQGSIHGIIDDRRKDTQQRQSRLMRAGVLPPQPAGAATVGPTQAQIAASICP